jgi:hypothetical protein
LRLSVPEDREFRDFRREAGRAEAPISPTLAALRTRRFVSASMLAQKAKQFDDGLYAAVDLAAQQGAGSFEGKAALLQRLAAALAGQPEELQANAPHVVLAAARLGQLDPQIPAQLEPHVRATIERFQKNELRSKPIGFYTWNDELAAVFQQDSSRSHTKHQPRAILATVSYDGRVVLESRTADQGYTDADGVW